MVFNCYITDFEAWDMTDTDPVEPNNWISVMQGRDFSNDSA